MGGQNSKIENRNIIIGIGGIAAIGILLLSRKQQDNKPINVNLPKQLNSQSIKVQLDEQNNVTWESIQEIHNISLDLVEEEYKNHLIENRFVRRQVKDQEMYYELIIYFYFKMDLIFNEQLQKLMEKLNISKEQMLGENSYQNLHKYLSIQDDVRQQIQGRLQGKIKIDQQKIVEILKYMVSCMQSEEIVQNLRDLQKKSEEMKFQIFGFISKMVNILLADKIFNKFGVEEEDLECSLVDFGDVEEIQSLLMQYGTHRKMVMLIEL